MFHHCCCCWNVARVSVTACCLIIRLMCTRNCFHLFSTLSATFHLQSVTISRECGMSCWSAMLLLITNNRHDVTISSVSFNRILYVYVPVRVSNELRHRKKINYDSSMDLCRVHHRRKVRNEHNSTEREQRPSIQHISTHSIHSIHYPIAGARMHEY